MRKGNKSRNIAHSGAPHWIITGHNKNDKEFFRGNEEALRKLQRKIA